MRRFADTLPVLRESAGTDTRNAVPAAFEPETIVRALGVPPAGNRDGSGPTKRPAEARREHDEAATPKPGRPLTAAQLPRAAAPSEQRHAGETAAHAAILPVDPPHIDDDVAARIAAAVAEAREEARAERERAVAAAREEERRNAETTFEAEREKWATEHAQSLKRGIENAFAALHTRLADAAAEALLPVLEGAMREKARVPSPSRGRSCFSTPCRTVPAACLRGSLSCRPRRSSSSRASATRPCAPR